MNNIDDKRQLTKDLLDWYDAHARILPWRESPTPYRVWVSEIMLQQTRIEAVIPYFERFLNALPTLVDLSKADDGTLSKLWEGLGYYHRVRNMKLAAIICMNQYLGELPSTYDELIKLPGIGAYTAGAIASIAFKQRVPAIDGNVLRVFSRIVFSEDDILKEKTKKKFQSIVLDYLPIHRPDDFNQAIMEIGQLVCIPNGAPKCDICPLSKHCIAYQRGLQDTLPIKQSKKKRRIEAHTILLFIHDEKVLLHHRDETGLLASLYEFINIPEALSHDEVIKRIENKGLFIKKMIALHPNKHIFSHVEWHMEGYIICLDEKIEVDDTHVWASHDEMEETYAIPTAFHSYKKALQLCWKENLYES